MESNGSETLSISDDLKGHYYKLADGCPSNSRRLRSHVQKQVLPFEVS